jgi:hypothetical protein
VLLATTELEVRDDCDDEAALESSEKNTLFCRFRPPALTTLGRIANEYASQVKRPVKLRMVPRISTVSQSFFECPADSKAWFGWRNTLIVAHRPKNQETMIKTVIKEDPDST